MNNGIKFIFGFSIGVVLGSVVTWRLAKTAYEKIVQDEIDSVKETYSRLYNKKTDKKLKTEEKEAYTAIVNNYTTKKEGGESSMDEFKPYVISPEEFGENDEYETISLTYYADGVLADDQDDIIDDVDDVVGSGSLTRFGEYEDDSVFVRNDEMKCDYEILLDSRNYYDVSGGDPLDVLDED